MRKYTHVSIAVEESSKKSQPASQQNLPSSRKQNKCVCVEESGLTMKEKVVRNEHAALKSKSVR